MSPVKIFLIVFFLGGNSWLSAAQGQTGFAWLEGTWTINTSRGTIVESWQRGPDSLPAGKSYFIHNMTDTVPQESIRFIYRDSAWHYVPTVVNQNAGHAVYFKLIYHRGQEFIAENPQHDFPQRVSYRRIGDLLYASIEGWQNGSYRKQNFDYQRKE